MKTPAFKKTKCQFCGQLISTGGAAFTSHMRMHTRRKEAIEFKRGRHLVFLSPLELANIDAYARLGEEQLPGQPKDVWDITDSLKDLQAVDPAQYFVTSGEAVKKADKLVKDVYSLAVKTRTFRDRLVRARGNHKYLETARENNKLIIKSKDGRAKPDINKEEEDNE